MQWISILFVLEGVPIPDSQSECTGIRFVAQKNHSEFATNC